MKQLDCLWKNGKDFLTTEYAIMGGAMSWVSDHALVSSISNAGGFGILACGAMPPELLDIEIKKTMEKTQKPFGVNLIVMHPKIQELIDVCIQNKISHVVLAGGIPVPDMINPLIQKNIKVVGFAPSSSIGKKLIRQGVNALIIEGSEAGGHIGPVSTSVLAQEILPKLAHEAPIFVAGGIGCGKMIASYLMMGAAGCQLGTRFVCAHESRAHPSFKKAFINANARDAIASVQIDPRFPVIPVRALANKATQDFVDVQRLVIHEYEQGNLTQKDAQLKIEHYWAGALRKAVLDGDIEHGSVMAGQSVGMVVSEQSTSDIIQELISQANEFFSTLSFPSI
jgi:enoyl-[acyl-carrier protein] reductase II